MSLDPEAVAEELHIVSLVVHAAPRRLEWVAGRIAELPEVILHASSPSGKLVVTLEAATADAIRQSVSRIQRIDGVLSAALVYQCSDTLDAMNEEVRDA